VPVQATNKTSPTITKSVASYANAYYSISYPSTFSYQEGQISGGGTSLTLKSQNPDSSNTMIIIQTYNPSVSSQSAIENFFSALKYQRSQITISNVPAVKYKGVFPIQIAKLSLRETAVIFTYQNQVYKLQFKYSGSTENNNVEQIFQGVVASFKLASGY
jgi:hypothetical protein